MSQKICKYEEYFQRQHFQENCKIIFHTELHKLTGCHSSPLHISLFVSLENTANLDNEILVYLLNKELKRSNPD